MSPNSKGPKDTSSKLKSQGAGRGNTKSRLPVIDPMLVAPPLTKGAQSEPAAKKTAKSQKPSKANQGFEAILSGADPGKSGPQTEQVTPSWSPKGAAQADDAQILTNPIAAMNVQKAMIGAIDRMFDLFQNLACQSNSKHFGTELELNWIRPSLSRESMQPWHESKASNLNSVFTGRISTRKWSMVVKGMPEAICVFILPAEKLISFGINAPSFKPYCRIQAEAKGPNVQWLMEEERLLDEGLMTVASDLFCALLRFARGEALPNEVFSTRPLGSLTHPKGPIRPTTTSDDKARSLQEDFFADMRAQIERELSCPDTQLSKQKQTVSGNEKQYSNVEAAKNAFLPSKYSDTVPFVIEELQAEKLDAKQGASCEAKAFDWASTRANPFSQLGKPRGFTTGNTSDPNHVAAKKKDQDESFGWKPVSQKASHSKPIVPPLPQVQPGSANAFDANPTPNTLHAMPEREQLSTSEPPKELSEIGKKAMAEYAALLNQTSFAQAVPSAVVSPYAVSQKAPHVVPANIELLSCQTPISEKEPDAYRVGDRSKSGVEAASVKTNPEIAHDLQELTFQEILKKLEAAIDRELVLLAKKGSESFAKRDLVGVDKALKASARLSQFRQSAASFLEEYS
jgi:hypothetical protein